MGTPRNLRYVRGLGKLLEILDIDAAGRDEAVKELD
jgi:hypothetical protein